VDGLEEFLAPDGVFNIDRATERLLILSLDIDNQRHYYQGGYGWGKHRTEAKGRYDWYGKGERVKVFDEIFDIALKHESIKDLLGLVTSKEFKTNRGNLNTNCRFGLIGWVIENDLHKDEDVIKLFLRGYFSGKEKVQVMEALIADEELDKLEIFWKSRAIVVQKMLIERAPLDKLPFLLGTKNKKLLALLEKKLYSISK